MPLPLHSSDASVQLSEAERLRAFGDLLGEALRRSRRQGGLPEIASGRECSKATSRAGKKKVPSSIPSEVHDLRSRIIRLLESHGALAPGFLGRHLERSHAPVYHTLRRLVADGVVETRGNTRGLRYRLRDGWREALAQTAKIRATNEALISDEEANPHLRGQLIH
jgi:DNA-binding transcriptional ArsR family regulator